MPATRLALRKLRLSSTTEARQRGPPKVGRCRLQGTCLVYGHSAGTCRELIQCSISSHVLRTWGPIWTVVLPAKACGMPCLKSQPTVLPLDRMIQQLGDVSIVRQKGQPKDAKPPVELKWGWVCQISTAHDVVILSATATWYCDSGRQPALAVNDASMGDEKVRRRI